MKKVAIVFSSLCMLLSLRATAQEFRVDRNDYAGAVYSYKASDFYVAQRVVHADTFSVVTFDGSNPSARLGAPDLPMVSRMMEIPLCERVEVRVSDVQMESVKALPYRLMPVQPAPSKSDKAAQPFMLDTALYMTDGFYANELASVEVMGVARDKNIAILRLSPFSYNPVTGELQRVTSMKVTLTYVDADMAATEKMHSLYGTPDFSIGQQMLSQLPSSKAVRDAAPLHYLIVSHSSFRGALDDFVAWKKRQGFLVTVAYTDDPGVGTTSTDIATYVKGYYTNATAALPAPTFLLLVGDHEQIPAFASRCTSPASDHVTDLYYATWTSGDNVPDCYYGRFSAKTVAQLTPQAEKTILYERYDFDNPDYLGKGILVAGVDGGRSGDNGYTYADPTMDYVAKTYVNLGHGFTDVRYYKNNTGFAPQGVTVTGSSNNSSTASALRTLYSKGYGWINYSAHGNYDEWSTPSFTVSNAASMNNTGKPSFMIGNCCLSGKFNVDACFGEVLLRRGQNAGAVAYIGATNSTYWPHDFCWSVGVRSNISNLMDASYNASNLGMYDRLFHSHGEDYTAWHATAGSMITSGNTSVEAYGSYALYYWEIYELFGDPSLMPWLGQASVMQVDASPLIQVGNTSYTVTVPPHAYVALTTHDVHDLVAAAYADPTSGSATLTLPATLMPGVYELVVWAQGYQPHFQEVTVSAAEGPYLAIKSLVPSNGLLLAGADNSFDVTVANYGVATAWSGTFTLTSSSEGVEILSPVWNLPYLTPGDSVSSRSAASVYIPASYTNGQTVTFTAVLDYGTQFTQTFTFPIATSQLVLSNVALTPSVAPDATVTVTCTVTNTGTESTDDLTFRMANNLGMVAQEAQPIHVGVIPAGGSADLSYTVQMAHLLPEGTVPFLVQTVTPEGLVRTLDTLKFFGTGTCTEDFESGALTQYNWRQGNNPWEVTTANKHSGTYSVRSKTNLSNRRTSDMSLSWTSTIDDSISFYYSVSSEEGYDKFIFYIDGESKVEASGTGAGWQYASFYVPAGTHTFKFAYTKDYSTTDGSDCAWVDDVTLPYSQPPYRYVAAAVCQNEEYLFGGTPLPTDQLGMQVYVDSVNTPRTWLALTVQDAPEVTITRYGIPAQGRRVVLVASGANRYEWSTGDTTAMIVVNASADMVYSVRGYRGECYGEATIDIPLGVRQVELVPEVSLYPNPAYASVTVVCQGLKKVTLINLLGQPLQVRETRSDEVSLDVQKLPEGVYYVKVETSDASVVRKFVKQ